MKRPAPLGGIRHLALRVTNLEVSVHFYTDILGMSVLRKASERLTYLTLGSDNLSLNEQAVSAEETEQSLDHFGFVVDQSEDVDYWHEYLVHRNVGVLDNPHDHSDGARSFHFHDPDKNVIQALYHPGISGQRFIAN